MPVINTVGDWWGAVDRAWGDLTDIVAHHMDMYHEAYEVPGDAKSPPTGRNIKDEIIYLKETRDRKLARYFAASWFLATENYCWSVPNWGTLCDLLSEEWVFGDSSGELVGVEE
jgi:hypothetical protein